MTAVISRISSVSGMTTPAMLSAAVVDMCTPEISDEWDCVRPGLGLGTVTTVVSPPQSRCGHAPRSRPGERARGVITTYLSCVIVAAAIGDVATAARQPTYL